MFTDIKNKVEKVLSGKEAEKLTEGLSHFDRWSAFDQYRLGGSYCAARMREYGLEDIEVMQIPADGETKFGDWTMPMAWDVDDAWLEIVEPKGKARLLANYRQEPATLHMWSFPTPPEGVETEVVLLEDAGDDAAYEGIDVTGKIVFANKMGGARGTALRHGAIGIITDSPAREDDLLAEGVRWTNTATDYHGWGYIKRDTPSFGFSLTREKGEYLRNLLSSGQTVKVKATIKSWLYKGSFPLTTGIIRGETDEEVLVFGHAQEYGASDNASGCALILESARTLNKLINEGSLPRPKRSIRFMMSWECYGSIAWCVQRIYQKRNVVAGLCLDGLGGKPEFGGKTKLVILNPHCQASFTDYAAAEVAKACSQGESGFTFKTTPWSGGTDHTIFEDPLFGVPMPWLENEASPFHHTSLDTMAVISRDSLYWEGVFAATYLYLMANAGEAESVWLAKGTRSLWEDQLYEKAGDSKKALAEQKTAAELATIWADSIEQIEYLTDRGIAAIESVKRLLDHGSDAGFVQEEIQRLEVMSSHLLSELEAETCQTAKGDRGDVVKQAKPLPAKEGADLIPRRLVPGLLTLCTFPEELRPEYNRVTGGAAPQWSAELGFAVYWADGQRTIGEIESLVRLEFGPVKTDLVGYFKFLHKLGYVEWA